MPPADEDFDATLAHALRAGVLLSAALIALGGVLFLAGHGVDHPAYGSFHGEPPELCSVRGITAAARRLDGRGVIQLGLIVLIGTPIARVVLSVVGFLRARDWLYVTITLVVLAELLYSITAG